MAKVHRESGSAFFIILFAIAMFAALSYAVMRSGGFSTSALTREQATMAAQEIIAYGETISKTVQTLKLRGCLETQLGFENTVWKQANGTLQHPVGHNPGMGGDACNVFSPTGGKASPIIVPADPIFKVTDPTHPETGHGIVFSVSVVGVGSTQNDLVLIFHYIHPSVCREINKLLNLTQSNVLIEDSWAGAPRYDGGFLGTAQIGEESSVLVGQTQGCIKWTGSGYGDSDVNYYKVLLTR